MSSIPARKGGCGSNRRSRAARTACVFLEDGTELLDGSVTGADDCLIASADSVAEAAATLRLVRELRNGGATLP